MPSEEAPNNFQHAERLKAQGSFPEAEAAYRAALDTMPRAPEIWWALGDLYARMENFAGVEQCCRKILAQSQDVPDVWLYLGMALQRQGKLEEAEAALQTSLGLNPGLVEGLHQLGIVQQLLGKPDASIDTYKKALVGIADRAPVLSSLSALLQRQGRVEEAFRYAFEAVQSAPDMLKYRRQFVVVLNHLCPSAVGDAQLIEILRCFDTPGLDTAMLMKPCMWLLGQNPDVQRAVSSAGHGYTSSEPLTGLIESLSANSLLRCVLLHTKIASPEVELLLGTLRRLLLDQLSENRVTGAPPSLLADNGFFEALACQFFNTDYAALVQAKEYTAVGKLAADLNRSIARDEAIDSDFVGRLLVYCMYRPLSSLEGVTRLYEDGKDQLAAVIPRVLKRQWEDYRREKILQDKIEVLTTIDDGVSAEVREQYEESPYPRWFSVDHFEPESCAVVLKAMFPHFDATTFDHGPVDVLVAGCGTGRHALMVATRFAKSSVLAVDLSKTSLAYAERQAIEAGITNVRFAQADILELGQLGRQFHVIESVGVLHHMQDPKAGLQVLSDMLVDRGVMRLGLYSGYGRRAVAAAREYIAEQGFEATADGMRAARQVLLALDGAHPASEVTRFRDFYTLSECRDLLFHVQEHRLKIPDLAVMLADCGLEFTGFALENAEIQGRYRERYPHDENLSDLSNWDEFEKTFPDTFEEMYQFWCQKSG